MIKVKEYLSDNHPLYEFLYSGNNSLFDDVAWIHPESIEELENISLEEGNIIDTRTVFNDNK